MVPCVPSDAPVPFSCRSRQYTWMSVCTHVATISLTILNSFALGFYFNFFLIHLFGGPHVLLKSDCELGTLLLYLCLVLVFHCYVLLTLFIRSKNFLWCVWPGIRACPGTHSFATYFTFSMLVLVSTVWDFYDHVLFFKLYHSKVWAVVVPNWLNFGLGPFSDCMLEGMFEHKGAYST